MASGAVQQALRQLFERWGRPERVREELRRVVGLAALSPEKLRRVVDGDPRLAGRPRRTGAEQMERSRQVMAAAHLHRPLTRALAKLLGSLSPLPWATLRSREQITFSTDPGPDELPLPIATARELRTTQSGASVSARDGRGCRN